MGRTSNGKTVNIYTAFYLPHPGGIERYVYHLSCEFYRLGYVVNIITTDHEKTGRFKQNSRGVAIYKLKSVYLLEGRFPIPTSIGQISYIFRNCHSNKLVFNILNTRFFVTTFLGVILGKINGNKNFVVEHGSGHFIYGNKITTLLCTFYCHLITPILKLFKPGFLAVSGSSKKWLEHFGIYNAGILSNGIDSEYVKSTLPTRLSGVSNRKIIFYAGRLLIQKGIVELIDAFNLFVQNHKEYVLIIAGSGELDDYVEKKADGSDGNIVFLNLIPHSEVIKILSQSGLYINPSNYPEGMPTTILEASSMGIPIITTDKGSVRDVVKDGETGFVLSKGSSEEIYLALKRFNKVSNKLKKGAMKFKKYINANYSWHEIVGRFAKMELK